MPPFIQKLIESFNKLDNTKKLLILAGFTILMSVMIVLIASLNSKKYSPIYYNVPASQAGEIIDFLKKQRVPFKINSKTGLVEVPHSKVYEVRMMLAKSGIPGDNQVGLEIFDRTKLGQTEFVMNINYIRALQGEIARSIESIRGIRKARVHIVIPKQSLFEENQLPATASIIIGYQPGYKKLSKSQVEGIVNLVSASVEGLKPENVKVIDSFGKVLTDILKEDKEEVTTEVAKRLDYKKKIEKYYENKIQSALEKVIGKNKVIAKVTADIDFTKSEKTIEFYDPENIAERSHQKVTEQATEYNPIKGGVPGVVSNVPSVMAQQQGTAYSENIKANNLKKQEIVNYEVSKTVSKVVNPVGIIKRLSIAVLVDGKYKEVKKGKKKIKEYVPRSKEEIEVLREIVMKAVGFNPERKDQVEVASVPFNIEAEQSIASILAGEERKALIFLAIKYGLTILALLIIFLFIFKPFLKVILQRIKPPEELVRAPKSLDELEKEVKEKAKGIKSSRPSVGEKIEKVEKNPKEILAEIIEQNPEEIAKFVKLWLRSKD